MADLIADLDPRRIAERLAAVRQRIDQAAAAAGRRGEDVEVLAAVKYIASEDLGALRDGGIRLVGENRAQDLATKAAAWPGVFEWDFIGHLQSRRVPSLLEHVRLIHSVASESALERLRRGARDDVEILVEVNVAGESGKSGIAAADLEAFIERSPVRVGGLMTMPPLVTDPEESRRHFAALRELAEANGVSRLSMGTSQDYEVAVQEGATIVRIGTGLYA